MGYDAYPTRDSQPDTVSHFVKFVGGASAVTKVYGPGVTVTYVAAGTVDLTWAENPGTFLGFTHGFQAATPGDLMGHTVIADTYDTSTRTLRVIIYNDTPAAHDLAASEWLCLDVRFKQTAV